MEIIVTKFGGSCTADADGFQKIHEIIESDPARRVVVLSAPGSSPEHPEKVTALLEACWRNRGQKGLDAYIHAVMTRFTEIAASFGVSGFEDVVERELRDALKISRDHLLSRGEYLCARLYSRYFDTTMIDAVAVVRFNLSRHPDMEFARRTLSDALTRHRRVVLPGFYGADADGRIAVFPRNGSDITGALAAAAVDADLYENWSDVPGLMSGDPRIVEHPHLIPRVSYRDMHALALGGAKLLHPDCLEPVSRRGIPTRLCSVDNPESPGTLVVRDCGNPPVSIAGHTVEAFDSHTSYTELVAVGMNIRETQAALELLRPESFQVEGNIVRFRLMDIAPDDAVRALHGLIYPHP